MKDCCYPDWEGGIIKDKHSFDKNGWCCICGVHKLQAQGKTDEFKVFIKGE